MQLGLCAHPADLAAFLDLPFDYIEGHVQKFLLPEAPEGEFAPHDVAARASRRPLVATNCLFPADLKITGPAADPARVARYAATAFGRAQRVGITTIVFGSAGARQVPDGWSMARGFEQYVEALRILAPLAQQHDVTVVVEPLNRGECNLVNTIDEGAEAVRRCGHPRVQLLADVFHMLRNGETPDAIERHADLITHSHIAENADRAQPGVHGDDFRPFFRALKRATRCPRLTLECVWEGEMAAAAAPALAVLRQQLADAGC